MRWVGRVPPSAPGMRSRGSTERPSRAIERKFITRTDRQASCRPVWAGWRGVGSSPPLPSPLVTPGRRKSDDSHALERFAHGRERLHLRERCGACVDPARTWTRSSRQGSPAAQAQFADLDTLLATRQGEARDQVKICMARALCRRGACQRARIAQLGFIGIRRRGERDEQAECDCLCR